MKKFLVLACCVLMLLTSCSIRIDRAYDSSRESTVKPDGSSASTAESGTPGVTTENPPEIPDTSGLTQVGERLWEIALPDYLSDAAQPYTLYNLSARGNYLLATFMDNPNTSEPSNLAILLLFDIRTGKLTAETRHSSDARFSLLDDGYVSVIENSTLRAQILDPSLKPAAEYPAAGSDIMTSLSFISRDRRYFVWYSEASRVMIKDLKTGAVSDVGATVSDPAYCSEHNGTAYLVTFGGDSQINYALDMRAGTLTQLDEYNGSSPVGSANPAFVHSELSSLIMLPEEPGRMYIFEDENPNLLYLSDYLDGRFVSQAVTDGKVMAVSLYSVRNSRKVTVSIPQDSGDSSLGYVRIADYGAVFFDVTVDFTYPKLYMWLPDEAVQGENISVTVTDGAGLLSRTESMKNSIENDYGIRVFYGSDGSSFNAFDYTAEPVTDGIRMFNGMRILHSTLGRFPKGIFGEMLDGSLVGFNFYLCGKLTGTASGSLDSALAITFTDYDSMTKRIACDIGGYYMLDQTIAHELMHVMDDALQNAENKTGVPYFSLWPGLLPKNVNYYYYYVDQNGFEPSDTSYTVTGEANEDNIYFIDAYSKTFPTEDRARIFEYLFKTENGTLSPSIRGSHLIEKCRALCIILRKVFPSVAAEDSVFWESGLGSIDEGELDVFIARFREYEKNLVGVG